MTDQPFPPQSPAPSPENTVQQVATAIEDQLRAVFYGQDAVVRQVLAAFLAGGHVLLEGKPGLGKTHLVLALAKSFGGDFSRIQFTPDLMPTDVTGFSLYDMGSQSFQLRKGPVFTNLLLADEINRAPAKTQAALLEVMQERQVTIDGTTHQLAAPYMTLATQNPIEQEGTYPLPEAQLDRFLMKIIIDYPAPDVEESIVAATTGAVGASGLSTDSMEAVVTIDAVMAAQKAVAAIQIVPEVVKYAVDLVRATRGARGIALGSGTRGAISLVQVAKAYAAMAGRAYVIPDDIKSATLPVLRHRVQIAPELAIGGRKIDDVITEIVNAVPTPRS